MATDAEALAAGFTMPAGTSPISGGDDALRNHARTTLDLVNDARFIKPFTGAGGDLDDYTTPGLHGYWSDTANIPLTDPPTSGNVLVLPPPLGTGVALTQIAFPYGMNTSQWKRFKGTGGYSAWVRMDAGAVDLTTVPTTTPQSPVQLRTLPLILTTGGSGTAGPTSGNYRMPIKYGATITRWRAHFRNNNPRFGIDGPAATISAVYAGPATSGQFTSAPAQIAAGLTTGTTDAVTPWQATPLTAGTEYAIAYSFTASATNAVVGGGWSASSVNGTSATLTRVVSLPLDVWIEAEVEATVPAVAAFGDSLSSGVSATLPVFDSWLSQWGRANGVLPVHYTASGDTMQGWSDGTAYKWQRWQGLSRPDAVVHAMGSNDVFGGANLDTLKARRAASIELLQRYVSHVIYGMTILPRTAVTGDQETTRRSYNTWIKTKPDAARDVFDVVPAISGNDETISPGFDADGIHLNTAGYAAMAGTLTRPLVSRALTDRLAALERDTGWRKLATTHASAARTGGTVTVKRTHTKVRMRFVDVQLPDGAGPVIVIHPAELPLGFTVPATGTVATVGNGVGSTHLNYLRANGSFWWVKQEQTTTASLSRAGVSLSGEIEWTTDDPWPTTLPGTPA